MKLKCVRCGSKKDKKEFSKDVKRKNREERNPYCRECKRDIARSYLNKMTLMYNTQVQNSKKRRHPPPNYTESDFRDWCIRNGYKRMYENWEKSKYNRWMAPSADRLDDDKPYTLDNLQLVTWEHNSKRGNISHSEPIKQYRLDGEFVTDWISASKASKVLQLSRSQITATCNGRKLRAGDFQFRYKDDPPPGPIVDVNSLSQINTIVHQHNLDGSFVKKWESLGEIQRILGYDPSNISKCIRGKAKTYKRFIWKRP